ncbi:putative GTP-ase activating protein [Dictyocaulus viviparus]|uniref:Putative GTP-ase activating protein n=1 Tax=Dictyocaulus viviparus TaxID=29172 RepID=A0A0D8XJE8_DICVI|nr:putative GTP-ase activating protein [Dictyocaulus viviparus]
MVNTAHASLSNSSLNAQKKRQDERNLRTLRELSALPGNRFCFECGQRGPTYVNITHGSFCCTTCSEKLIRIPYSTPAYFPRFFLLKIFDYDPFSIWRRGLNPPHRVKSISMATFTNEEIERIRSLGNEENSHTWLGLYSGTPPKIANKEEFTAFLIRKYEKKEWYVSKSELEEQERLLNQAKEVASQSGISVKSSGSTISKQQDLDLFSSDPFTAFGAPMARPVAQVSQDLVFHSDSHNVNQNSSQPFSPPAFAAPPPPLPLKPPVQNNQSAPQVSDPFAPAVVMDSTSKCDLFADFDAKFGDLSLKNSSTVHDFGSPLRVQPLPKSATVSSSLPSQSGPLALYANPFQSNMLHESSLNIPAGPKSCSVPTNPNSDKYSALAELDQMFHHTAKPNLANKDKPAWLPSGFSTGLPPAHCAQTFGDSTQTKTSVGFSSLSKSSTLGAISEMETSVATAYVSSFDNTQQQVLSNSYANITTNPFAQQPFETPYHQQTHGPHIRNTSTVLSGNPFTMPYYQTHGDYYSTICRSNITGLWVVIYLPSPRLAQISIDLLYTILRLCCLLN